MTEKYFKQDAKQIVDTLFDNKLFIDSLTRDDLNSIEDYLQYAMESRFNSHVKSKELSIKISRKEDKNSLLNLQNKN